MSSEIQGRFTVVVMNMLKARHASIGVWSEVPMWLLVLRKLVAVHE
jgi:hypothetical protein